MESDATDVTDPVDIMVDVRTLADWCNLSAMRIQQLAQEGWIKKHAHGQYPLAASMQGYIRYLKEGGAGRSTSEELKAEELRLKRAQANRIEMENAEKADLFVLADDAQWALESVILSARSELERMPRKIKKHVQKNYDVDIELEPLQGLIDGALAKLSEHAPHDDDEDPAGAHEMEAA